MLEIKNITKRYHFEKVLDSVNLSLPDYGFISIVGPSGCGKSTLLHIIGGIDNQYYGIVLYNGKNIKYLSSYRKKNVCFLFQDFYLIPWLSLSTNIHLSRFFYKQFQSETLNLKAFEKLKHNQLSLGQRQRVAYLRSSLYERPLLLCDEPTGSLDYNNALKLMNKLKEESKHRLVIMVSHNRELVDRFSDEVYEMKDGKIINHQKLQESAYKGITLQKKKKYSLSLIRLTLSSILSHKKRCLQLLFSMTVSLFCIITTVTMSQTLKKQVESYIYSLVPSSAISFRLNSHTSLKEEDHTRLKSLPEIERISFYLKDYEHLGIGFNDRHYQESETLFISDDTLPYQHLSLRYGTYPKENNEILLSYSTAMHLTQSSSLSSLIGKQIYSWYKKDLKVNAIAYTIVGITSQQTTLDTLYQKENAYLFLLEEKGLLNKEEAQIDLGIIYIHPQYNREDVIKKLKKNYYQYEYKEVGASTFEQVSKTMDKIQIILLLFSSLMIMSSLFLMGEVMYLNSIQKKKDYSIMRCFGASTFQIMRVSLFEIVLLLGISQVITLVLFKLFIFIMTWVLNQTLLFNQIIIQENKKTIFLIFIISFILTLMSQVLPLISLLKMNMIKGLKE